MLVRASIVISLNKYNLVESCYICFIILDNVCAMHDFNKISDIFVQTQK